MGCLASRWPAVLAGLALASGCAAVVPPGAIEPGAGPAATRPLVDAVWPAGGDCRALAAAVVAMPAAERRALPPASSPFALAVVERGLPLPGDTAAWLVAPDFPLPATDSLDAAPPRCLVMVERADTTAAAVRRPLGTEVVGSSYHGGTRRVKNPDHAALKDAADELERADSPGMMSTGDPGIDLIGMLAGAVLDGIDLVGRQRRAANLRTALAETPASVDEPVWQPYTFRVSTLQAERASYLRAALVDRTSGAVWYVAEPLREVKTFRIAAGRHARDRELLEARAGIAASEADIDVWEEGGLRIALSELLARLATATPAAGTSGAASLAAAWASHPPPRVAGLDAGRSRIEPAAGPEPAAEPGGATHRSGSLVRQEVLPDGTRRYRLVSPEGS